MPQIEVRRSRRRTRTVQAFHEDGRLVVAIPDRFTAAQEEEWVARMVEQVERKQRRLRPSDTELAARAKQLSARYLDGRARPRSVAWVGNQTTRWGSCTPATASVRVSDQVKGMPGWVLDYVLVHELAHLLEAGHGPAFWAWVQRYPHTERARGFLDGASFARRQAGQDAPAPGDEAPGEDPVPQDASA